MLHACTHTHTHTHTHTLCGMCWLHADSAELGFIAFISEGQWSGVGISRQSKPLGGRRLVKFQAQRKGKPRFLKPRRFPPLQCSLEMAQAVWPGAKRQWQQLTGSAKPGSKQLKRESVISWRGCKQKAGDAFSFLSWSGLSTTSLATWSGSN